VVEHADRLSVLDATHAQLVATPRAALPHEPPAAVNEAYVSLVFACGHARLGAADRAAELQRAAMVTLAPLADDPAHAWLVAAFGAR
jgi:hypothetical protein